MLEIQASALSRALACNGSIAMDGSSLPIATPTEDKQEGIAAHHVATAVLSGMISDPFEYVDRKTPNGIYVSAEMAEFVDTFIAAVRQRDEGRHVVTFVETACDFPLVAAGVTILARPDYVVFDGETLDVDDFKYGFRIREPEDNVTLLAYAMGMCLKHNWTPTHINMTIHQPRPYHPDGIRRSWPIAYVDLLAWYARLTEQLAELNQELHTSEHCRSCAVLAICAAARMAAMNSIEAANVVFVDMLPDDALSFELTNLNRAQQMIKDRLSALNELAMFRVKGGTHIKDYDIEMALGNRRFKSHVTPEMLSLLSGKPLDTLRTTKTISPAQFEKLPGIAEAMVKELSERPSAGLRLVRSNLNKKAAKAFKK